MAPQIPGDEGTDTADLAARVAAIPYWYHKIDLPGGITTPGWAPIDPAAYRVPEDLTGMRVLDVGAWDGYWPASVRTRDLCFARGLEFEFFRWADDVCKGLGPVGASQTWWPNALIADPSQDCVRTRFTHTFERQAHQNNQKMILKIYKKNYHISCFKRRARYP